MSLFSVVYDACVLYPAPLRDLLMRLAMTDLFCAHWTDEIHEEWINALLRGGRYTRDKLERVKALMDANARDACVNGYQPLISGLTLPDPDDRHVLINPAEAAASENRGAASRIEGVHLAKVSLDFG